MSDPMTSAEVEDILSSIRRLVSEENRTGPGDEAAEQKPIDRLVLTPSLRVESEIENAPELEGPAAVAPASDADSEAPMVELDEAETAEDAGADSDQEAASEEPPLAFEFRKLGPMRLHNIATAVDQTAVQMPDATSEIDGPGPDESASEHGPVEEAIAEPPTRDEKPFSVSVLRQPPSFAPDVPQAPEADASLGEKIAALETLIASRADRWEPDQADETDYAGTDAPPLEWQDAELHAEDFTPGEPAASETVLEAEEVSDEDEADSDAFEDELSDPETAEDSDDGALQEDEAIVLEGADAGPADEADFDDDATLLDEEALREIVAEVVRQELQGALGERITRNVRKLVRREIHRALAAQDLE